MKKQPTGFIGICTHCGATVAAMDFLRTDRASAGKLLGEWLVAGYTIKPMFGGRWEVRLAKCKCEDEG